MRRTQAGFKDGRGELAPDLLVRLGPTLLVDVGLRARGVLDGVPDLEFKRVWALVDTGASDNCIDAALAGRAKLPVLDQQLAFGIGGATRVNMYMGRIYIPSLNQLLFQPFLGVDLASSDQRHLVLLGRTFLKPYTFTYRGLTGDVDIRDEGEFDAT